MYFGGLCQSFLLAIEPVALARLSDPDDVRTLAVHLHLGADVALRRSRYKDLGVVACHVFG